MDSQDPRSGVKHLVSILRKVTRIVQLLPFAYLLLLSVYLLLGAFLPEWAVRLADNMLNAPVYAVLGLLGAGRLLKLCKWFKAACLLPVTTKVENYVDSFMFTFTQNEVILINAILAVLFISFVVIAYRRVLAR